MTPQPACLCIGHRGENELLCDNCKKKYMTREIKFRAWDNLEEIMRKNWTDLNAVDSSIFLMQYTGLLDKNGKEIYEGDIVRLKKLQMEVSWSDEKARWRLYEIGFGTYEEDMTFDKAIKHYYEIIGNVHENPDLLTPTYHD